MSKFADDLLALLADQPQDPFEVVEALIGVSATLMASDPLLDLNQAQMICVGMFNHSWHLRRRAMMPCDGAVH